MHHACKADELDEEVGHLDSKEVITHEHSIILIIMMYNNPAQVGETNQAHNNTDNEV